MAIRVYDNYDFEGEEVEFVPEYLYLGEAKDYALQHKCNIMIRSWKGWTFKNGPSRAELGDTKPSALVECSGKKVYII